MSRNSTYYVAKGYGEPVIEKILVWNAGETTLTLSNGMRMLKDSWKCHAAKSRDDAKKALVDDLKFEAQQASESLAYKLECLKKAERL